MAEETTKRKDIRQQVRKQTAGYILTALGLVAGLAWNEAIRALIVHFYPLDQNSLWAKFVYALLVTIVVVIVSAYLLRSDDN